MSLAVARWGVETAVLLALGLALLAGALALAERIGGPQAGRGWLRLGYAMLMAALLLPLLLRLGGTGSGMFPAPMEVWSDARGGAVQLSVAITALQTPHARGIASPTPRVGEGAIAVLALALLAGAVAGLGHLGRATIRLRRLCKRAIAFRQLGRISICASDEAGVPFSAWTGARVYVVLPTAFLLEPARMRLAIAHELHHIRSRDTGWAYLLAFVRALFPWHPAAHGWLRCLSRLQEMACDEHLAARRGLSARAYGDCLVWAAEMASGARQAPVGVVAMLNGSGPFLARRIRRLMAEDRPRRAAALPAGLALLALLGGMALLARGAIADDRLSLAQARELAGRVERNAGLRISVDETVLAALNKLAGTAEGRASFAEGLGRMPRYLPLTEAAFQRHGIPRALLAIPQMESRFQVLPEARTAWRSAGIWQFIPVVARNYGLRVDASVDQRLEPAREVEAAAAYLADMHSELQDWPLVIAAYNSGQGRVRRAVEAQRTRDVSALVRGGALSPYVSRVLAAALLMQAPELLR